MYKLILFDFDGTIGNTIEFGIPIYNELAKKYNFLEIKDISELSNYSVNDFIKMHKINRIKLPFYFKKLLLKLKKDMQNVKIYPGMKEVIKKLNKKYKLGIVSANRKENIELFLKKNGLEYCFDFVENYSLFFGKARKLKKLIKEKKLRKNEVIYIGDEVRDIEECKKAGIEIMSVTWGFHKKSTLEKKKPKYLINETNQILKILK